MITSSCRYWNGGVKAVKTGGEPPVMAAIGVGIIAVLDTARQSAHEGRSITLEGS